MSGEILYLSGAIAAFAAFSIMMLYVSTRNDRSLR